MDFSGGSFMDDPADSGQPGSFSTWSLPSLNRSELQSTRTSSLTSSRDGKEVLYEVQLQQLRSMARWLDQIATQWEQRLGRLKAMAERR